MTVVYCSTVSPYLTTLGVHISELSIVFSDSYAPYSKLRSRYHSPAYSPSYSPSYIVPHIGCIIPVDVASSHAGNFELYIPPDETMTSPVSDEDSSQ